MHTAVLIIKYGRGIGGKLYMASRKFCTLKINLAIEKAAEMD